VFIVYWSIYCLLSVYDLYTDCSCVRLTYLHSHCLHRRSNVLGYSDGYHTGIDQASKCATLNTDIRQTHTCTRHCHCCLLRKRYSL